MFIWVIGLISSHVFWVGSKLSFVSSLIFSYEGRVKSSSVIGSGKYRVIGFNIDQQEALEN